MLTASINFLSAFPGRRVYADDVIWTGNDEDGFHTSHRVTTIGRNLGHSNLGPPTGRSVNFQVIANCLVKENLIVEEWLVRDGLAMVRQLGFADRQTRAHRGHHLLLGPERQIRARMDGF